MKVGNRKILIGIAVLVAAVTLFFGARSFIFSKIHSGLDDAIESLNANGYTASYDTLSVHWGKNLIEISGLSLKKGTTDSTCLHQESIAVSSVRAEGFALLPLIFNDILSFDRFLVDTVKIVMHKDSQLIPEGSQDGEDDLTLSLGSTIFRAVEFVYTDSVGCNKLADIRSDFTIEGLTLEFLADQPFAYQVKNISAGSTALSVPQALYTFEIQQIKWDFVKEIFRADSIRVVPQASKFEFSKQRGFEIDRFDAFIPFVEAQNFSVSFLDSSRVRASQAEIQFYLNIFRDKRRPFVQKRKPLPIPQIQDLPFTLLIDSLKIRKSYVQYEEFAEEATEAGLVYFDNLYASLYNINNRATTGNTRLRAQSNLLGHGAIDLFVNFPLEANKNARLVGSISDFDIPEINAMLVPSTNIKVESGDMKKLSFTFAFNDTRSDGEIELNYENLKLSMMKEDSDKEDEMEKDNLKTFIMNTFIIRKNMDEDVPEEKRTGAVGFERDPYRSIFNFWVKSLLSGVKAAYNLDKVAAKQTEKELKKAERLARKETKKIKRAEKKRDRG